MEDKIHKRTPLSENVEDRDVAILGTPLHFKTSDRSTKNRFMKAAMTEQMASFRPEALTEHGIPSKELINLYEKWGNSRFGMILTGNFIIDHRHLEAAGNVILSRETESTKKHEQLVKLAQAAKADGALAIVQLSHGGYQTPITINKKPYSSSDTHLKVRARSTYGKPIPFTIEQIRNDLIPRFIYAAIESKSAGFDGVQLHGAHGYLLTQFLSAKINKRTDEFGGSIENRFRIVEEIYRGIREKIPASTGFIVGIKINSFDAQNNIEDVLYIVEQLDKLSFDFIELSGGTYENWQLIHHKESTKKREAFFLECSSAIIPHLKNSILYLTGGFRTVPFMVKAIKNGETNGIGLARPVTAEPDFPHKVLTNQVRSVPFNYFEQDFSTGYGQSITQMHEASKTPWSQCNNDPCYGITDFSVEKEAKNFENGVVWHLIDILKTENWTGKPFIGYFEYDHKTNYGTVLTSFLRWVTGLYSRYLGFKK